MNILIAGGTGFIGRHLAQYFIDKGHHVYIWARTANQNIETRCLYISKLNELNNFPIDVIVNLAGAPIDKRWTNSYKSILLYSRVDTISSLINWVSEQKIKPKLFLSASAIGYFGAQVFSKRLKEHDQPHFEYTHYLCNQLELAAKEMEKHDVRTCVLRLGVVLGHGGALYKMLPAFKMGFGGKIGNGNQGLSWIHMTDVCRAIDWLVEHSSLQGCFNLTAPQPVTNHQFARQLAETLQRPCWFTTPQWLINLLFGEMGNRLLAHGQHVVPYRLMQSNFKFDYTTIDLALMDLLKPNSK